MKAGSRPGGLRRLASLAAALALGLAVTACASGPLGSHGVDYIPAFDNQFTTR